MQDLAQSILNIEKQIQDLKAQAEAQRAALTAQMQEENVSQVIVPGAGYISFVKENIQTRLDSKTAQAKLEEAGIAVPIMAINIKASLRVHMNK